MNNEQILMSMLREVTATALEIMDCFDRMVGVANSILDLVPGGSDHDLSGALARLQESNEVFKGTLNRTAEWILAFDDPS